LAVLYDLFIYLLNTYTLTNYSVVDAII